MASPNFTEEEMRILMENPYTLNVTPLRFALTKEGKERILSLSESGKTIAQILREMGYDPKMLGRNRTKNLIRKIKEEAESRTGIHNGYAKRNPKRLTVEQIVELQENPASYSKLKTEVIYLREEVEFLKKISQKVISGKRGK